MKQALKSLSYGFFVGAMIFGGGAQAAFPDRPVHMIVTSAAGGGTDTMARYFGAKLSEKWGQPVIVDAKPGADGVIAEDFVAHAAPDGYTIMMDNASHSVLAADPNHKLPFDPVGGFSAITLIGTQPEVLLAHPTALPVNTLADMLALAKAKPGTLTFGDSGLNGPPYLGMALLMGQTGTDMLHVSYKSTGDALIGLMGGEVQMMLGSISTVSNQIKNGKLKALALMADQRSPALPDVPTVAEVLKVKSFAVSGWYGMFAPAKTSPDILNKIHDDVVAIINSPETQERLAKLGLNATGNTPAQFDTFVRNEVAMWTPIVKNLPAK